MDNTLRSSQEPDLIRRFRRSAQDVKVRRGANAGSDHELVTIKLKFKLARVSRPFANCYRYAVKRLNQDVFRIELRNRFEELNEDCEMEEDRVNIGEAYSKTTEEVMGRRNKTTKPWLSRESWRGLGKGRTEE